MRKKENLAPHIQIQITYIHNNGVVYTYRNRDGYLKSDKMPNLHAKLAYMTKVANRIYLFLIIIKILSKLTFIPIYNNMYCAQCKYVQNQSNINLYVSSSSFITYLIPNPNIK